MMNFGHRFCCNTKTLNLTQSFVKQVSEIATVSVKTSRILSLKSNQIKNGQKNRKIHYLLSNKEIQQKRIELFDKEARRQNALITDIEKIQVQYKGIPEDASLMMNKHLSTPYNCAQHISHLVLDKSVIAEVDGEIWDMFRPLTKDCTLRFLHFKEADPYYVNKAFWRSLSLMLGSVLEEAFNENIYVQLCSFPPPTVRSGSFVYDIDLNIDSWEPKKEELQVLSGEMIKLALANKPFQRLEVDANVAIEMFSDNRYKKAQIPHMAALSKSGKDVVVYRIGDFLDLSRGPTISHTGHLGKCTITAIHRIETDQGKFFRVQGVALPKGFLLNHFSYSILEDRAKKINPGRIPNVAAFEREPTVYDKNYSLEE